MLVGMSSLLLADIYKLDVLVCSYHHLVDSYEFAIILSYCIFGLSVSDL